MSGNIGEGIQYELIFDTSTFTTHRRNHVLGYTGVDHTCETIDSSATLTYALGLAFAGVAFVDFPYVEMSAALADPYDGTNMSIPYPGGETGMVSTDDMITVLHRCRTFVIPAETVAAGNALFRSEVADGAGSDIHDGMVEVVDTGEVDEIASAFGIAETGFTVPGTHADHAGTWNQDDGQYTGLHEAVWVSMWR
ncbi:MAG: hypothetical protein GQ580_06330 [Candidatus Thorarchaeota archaeon]|nr:hypothetical protein [Candidatus Thorarchaeota archaeon]